MYFMKSGLIVIIAIVVLLAAVGGYFYLNTNDNRSVVCAADVQQCSDGSFVSRDVNNNCEFAECPSTGTPDNQTNITDENQTQTLNIQITDFKFSQATLEIHVGDTVTWTNKESMKHTVTSNEGKELNSPTLSLNKVYSHTFTTAGEYDYHCIFHSWMDGKVIVR